VVEDAVVATVVDLDFQTPACQESTFGQGVRQLSMYPDTILVSPVLRV
jgi:hypothetical protein